MIDIVAGFQLEKKKRGMSCLNKFTPKKTTKINQD